MKLARTIIIALVVLVIFFTTAYALNWGLGVKYGEGPFDSIISCAAKEEPAEDISEEQDDNYEFETKQEEADNE